MQDTLPATIQSMSVSPEAFPGARSAIISSGRGFVINRCGLSTACACACTSCNLMVEASAADPVCLSLAAKPVRSESCYPPTLHPSWLHMHLSTHTHTHTHAHTHTRGGSCFKSFSTSSLSLCQCNQLHKAETNASRALIIQPGSVPWHLITRLE